MSIQIQRPTHSIACATTEERGHAVSWVAHYVNGEPRSVVRLAGGRATGVLPLEIPADVREAMDASFQAA